MNTTPPETLELPATPLGRAERWWGASVLLASIVVTAWPMFRPLEEDSFPLSTFPMFARHRGTPVMHQFVGIEGDGTRVRITPELVGTSEVLQAKAVIDRAARSKKRSAALCRVLANHSEDHTEFRNVRSFELYRVKFDPVRYFTEGPEPIEQKLLYKCPPLARSVKSESSPERAQ
jgi:hypothetical protein